MTLNRLRGQEPKDAFEGRRHKPDYILLLLVGLISLLGLIVIFSISPALASINELPSSFYFMRHLLSFGLSVLMFIVVSRIPGRWLKKLIVPGIALSIVTSIMVLTLEGIAARWVTIGGLSFQPAELIKLTVLLALGLFLSRQIENKSIADFHKTLKPILYGVGLIALILVVLQRDLGSMAVVVAMVGVMLFMARVPLKSLVLGAVAIMLLATIAVASTPYRRQRFDTFMNPERDCQSEGYHACQALIAVGSGGIFGLGVGNTVQAYGYLPESATDSIFAIYAEKFGFVGAVALIALYGGLLSRLIKIVRTAPNYFYRLMVSGVTAWIGFQGSINIGAMLGLLPLKGITLPLMSYGGSSMLFIMMSLGLVYRLSHYTLARKSEFIDVAVQQQPTPKQTVRVQRS
jgi:cell division protein FtsW